MLKRTIPAFLMLTLIACGGGSGSPAGPAPTPGGPPPAPVTGTVSGTVSSAAGGAISGASLRIVDGPNAGRTAGTDGNGQYQFANLQTSGFTIEVTAGSFEGTSRGVTVSPSSPNATANFTLLPSALWSRSGSGDNVFDMPTYVKRVRITGRYTGFTSNFIVRIGGSLVVNELLGTGWSTLQYDGTLQTNGGVVAITNSSGVQWSFTEVR